jgi:hypothetical protein
MTFPHNDPAPPTYSTSSGEAPTEPVGTWGAPVPVAERRSSPWSTKKIIVSAAVAVVIVAGGTAAVMAATNGNATTGTGNGFPGGFPGPGGRFGGGAGGLMNALHGDFVVANGSNGYTTERLQTGTVTTVSSGSLTVKSADGYTQSYVIGSNTSVDRGADSISKVATGNKVTVIATLSGQTATATSVEDSTIDSATGQTGNGQGGGFGGGPGNGSGGAAGNGNGPGGN